MSSDVVVDTHVLLWMLGDDRKLSARARRAIDEAQRVLVSSISFWEVGMLVEKGRVELEGQNLAFLVRSITKDAVQLEPKR